MAQGFYTLDEAATFLGMAPEELNRMAQKREIRAFADRGTWRFRVQDIEDLGRRRAAGTSKPAEDEDTFGMAPAFDENVEIGQEILPSSGSRSGSRSTSPTPREKGDSDLPLAVEDEFTLQLTDDGSSGTSGTKRKSALHSGDSGRGQRRRTGFLPAPRQDSGARLAPLPGREDDSDVRLDFDAPAGAGDSMINVGDQPPRKPDDSDVRLELGGGPPKTGMKGPFLPEDDSMVTEEIDLDAGSTGQRKSKLKRKTKPPELPTVSPFELSESDLAIPGLEEGGSDFDLSLDADASGDLKLAPKDDDDDEVELGELPPINEFSSRAGQSGINLQAPADSGVSLEEDDFDLSLDADEAPAKAAADDAESDFELTLDEDSAQAVGGEKDIFETDFDLPALDDESASEAVPLDEVDTDLESSDFDLSLEGESSVVEEDSDSLELDEEEAPRPKKRKAAVVDEDDLESSTFDDLLNEDAMAEVDAVADEEDEEEEEEPEPVFMSQAAPANWGILPAIMLIPTVIVMIVVGLMGFELLHGMWGYQQPSGAASPLLRGIAGAFTDDLPKE